MNCSSHIERSAENISPQITPATYAAAETKARQLRAEGVKSFVKWLKNVLSFRNVFSDSIENVSYRVLFQK